MLRTENTCFRLVVSDYGSSSTCDVLFLWLTHCALCLSSIPSDTGLGPGVTPIRPLHAYILEVFVVETPPPGSTCLWPDSCYYWTGFALLLCCFVAFCLATLIFHVCWPSAHSDSLDRKCFDRVQRFAPKSNVHVFKYNKLIRHVGSHEREKLLRPGASDQ